MQIHFCHHMIPEGEFTRYRYNVYAPASLGVSFAQQSYQFSVCCSALQYPHDESHMAADDAACPTCGKPFKYAAWMRKHQVVHESKAQVPCPCHGCHKRLKSNETLRTHVLTQYKGQYPLRCSVCSKGFRNRMKLTVRHRSHGRQEGRAQQAACSLLGREVVRLLEIVCQLQATSAATSSGASRCTASCSRCKARVPRDDTTLFACSSCNKLQHWTCDGLCKYPSLRFLSLAASCVFKDGIYPLRRSQWRR